jgi:class 3 adenylate cyclase
LTVDDLMALGIASVGHRRKLLAAMAAFKSDLAHTSRGNEVGNGLTPRSAPHRSSTDAERRQLTVMFIDLVGSTSLSAQLDPEDMREIIRNYQNAVAGEIARFEGHIAKFMGDGVLAYFGWPRAREDAAERAVQAGLAVARARRGARSHALTLATGGGGGRADPPGFRRTRNRKNHGWWWHCASRYRPSRSRSSATPVLLNT